MKKVIATGVLLSCAGFAQPIEVQLDGRRMQFDQPPVSMGGRLMVPLRGIFEALQAEVLYDARTRSIKATKGSTVVELTLGSRQALINGRSQYLDVPAETLGGRTMVPLRFVSESLGAEVKWNGATRTVLLSSGQSPVSDPIPNPTTAGKPRLEQVIHNATRTLNPGDSFDVIITGDPGGQASFEILGALQPQPVPEVSPGRYEKRFVVPNGLAVEQGVLVGHLSRGGQDTLSEASRMVNIQSSGAPTASAYDLTPAPNSEVQEMRPLIRILFPEDYQRNSVRLYLDQIEVTRTAQPGGRREIQFTPQFDLTAGSHQVEAQAVARNGQNLNAKWSFRITQPQSGPVLEPPDGQTITVLRPRISASFDRPVSNWRLVIDRSDFTSASSRNQYQISWTPPYDISLGAHQVEVTATDQQGRILQKAWAFNVNPNVVTPNIGLIMQEAIGTYRYEPYQNNWHEGTISAAGTGLLKWTNKAGVSWNLQVDGSNFLRKESGSPYQGAPAGSQFELLRGPRREVTGFRFNNDIYSRVQPGQPQSNLTVDNLVDGMQVPVQFDVQGSGSPGSRINLMVNYIKQDVLSVLTGTPTGFSVPGSVDSAGRYRIPLHIGSIPRGTQFTLTLTDSLGNPPTTRTLRRQ